MGMPAQILQAFSKLPADLYSLPPFGNATLLHFTDCHAQLLPVYYREPRVNIGVGQNRGVPPHLTGKQFLDYFSIKPASSEAYAFTSLDFQDAAGSFDAVVASGDMSGFGDALEELGQACKSCHDEFKADD